jgi:low temperature requirement protein LtrA
VSEPTEPELRVSPLELFFDLVFVFSITQVVQLMAADPTTQGLIGGLLVLLLVWWAWSQYSWALNSLGNEATPIKLALLVAMGAVLFMALAVPAATGDGGLWFAVGYTAVLLLGLLVYAVGLPRDRLPDLARYAVPALAGVLTVLIGGFVEGEARLVVWGIGIAIQVLAAFASGGSDYAIRPAHFAERHALFVIIALGEIVVAVGLAAAGGERDVATAIAVSGAFLVAAVLWWAYFDWLAAAMERALAVVTGSARTRTARDLFTLGHIPLIMGVVLYAVAAEEAAAHPGDPLEAHGRTLLALAVALAIGAYVYLAYRSDRFIAWERLAAGALAIVAVLGLQDVNGGVVLWIVAILIGIALAVEKRQVAAHRLEAERREPGAVGHLS